MQERPLQALLSQVLPGPKTICNATSVELVMASEGLTFLNERLQIL